MKVDDSLDTVELLMALEDGGNDFSLGEAEAAKLNRLLCSTERLPWKAPDASGAWPEEVLVFGREGRRVLFHAGLPDAFGVGCVDQERIVAYARVYPSLSRALYAFLSHPCA